MLVGWLVCRNVASICWGVNVRWRLYSRASAGWDWTRGTTWLNGRFPELGQWSAPKGAVVFLQTWSSCFLMKTTTERENLICAYGKWMMFVLKMYCHSVQRAFTPATFRLIEKEMEMTSDIFKKNAGHSIVPALRQRRLGKSFLRSCMCFMVLGLQDLAYSNI